MKKPLLIYALLFCAPLITLAQTKWDTLFVKGRGQETPRDQARYYRLVSKTKTNGLYIVEDHYLTGELQMKGHLSTINPEVKEGYFTYYLKNGQISQEGAYETGMKEGIWKEYNGVTGKLHASANYKDDKLDGDDMVYYPSGTMKKKYTYQDGKLLSTIGYDETGKELKEGQDPDSNMIFTIVQQMPKFNGDLAKYIQDNLKYPEAERKAGITGKVYVSFVVEKNGAVSGVKLLRGVANGPGLENAAIAVVSGMPAWIPGMQNDHAVRVQYNLPINFALKDNASQPEPEIIPRPQQNNDPNRPLSIVEQMPKFNGDLKQYLQNHIAYPENEKKNNITGKVYVTFVVERDGSISHVKLLRGVPNGPGLDNAAIAVVATMPNWIPGIQSGQPVRVQFTLPISFDLKDNSIPVVY